MKKWLLSTIILLSTFGYGQEMLHYRHMLERAVKDRGAADKILKLLEEKKVKSNLLHGYEGMAHFFVARHHYNPVSKLNHFHKGKHLLDGAINRDKNNLELRFYRLLVQEKVPFVLKYSSNLEEDRKFVFENSAHAKDRDLAEKILKYKKKHKK